MFFDDPPRRGLRHTETPPSSANPLIRTTGDPLGGAGVLRFDVSSNPPRIPAPSIITVRSSGTTMSTPPMMATATIVTSCASRLASRRSRSIPPNMAKALNCWGTTQEPLRSAPPKIAIALDDVGTPPTRTREGFSSGSGIR
jgi:hypothetical protein